MSLKLRFMYCLLLVGPLLVAGVAAPCDAAPGVLELVEKSSDTSDLREAYELLLQATRLNVSTKTVPGDREVYLRALLFTKASRLVVQTSTAESEHSACSRAHRIISEVEVFRPTVKEANDPTIEGKFEGWPMLLLLQAVCESNRGEKDASKVTFARAMAFRKSPFAHPKEMAKAYNMAEHNTKSADPFRVGAYVTNRGVLQDWIGRVVKKRGKTVQVRFTYTREDGRHEGRTGHDGKFPINEVLPLKAVSFEALKRGWR